MQSRKKSISFLNQKEDNFLLATHRFDHSNSKLNQMEKKDITKNNNATKKLVKSQMPASLSILKKPKKTTKIKKEISQSKINSVKKISLLLKKNKFFYLCPGKYSKKIYITRSTLIYENKIPNNEMPEKVSKKCLKKSNALLLDSKRIEGKGENGSCLELNKQNFMAKSIQNNLNSIYLVEIRAVVLKLGGIDTLNEKFYAEAFIEAKWIDVRRN